ncbi:MAG: hypothetical protein Q8L48_27095 [Archangium sp.]|nr:hypothetical protein [Archangium sp.]
MLQNTETEKSPVGFAFAAIFNFVFMLVLNAHAVWRPWLHGVVTASFVDVLWAANLGFVVQIFGNLVLSVTSPRPLRRVMDLIFASAALVGAVVFYRVFPFDLARFGEPVVVTARVLLALGVFGSAVAIMVSLVRLLASAFGGGTRPHTPVHP